jgi:hypothetical protein
MNRNLTRLGLAGAAAFYVVVGGLWASTYFPLEYYIDLMERRSEMVEELGFDRAYSSKEYQDIQARMELYALRHPDPFETERTLALYGSLLLWGTVALGAGGGVLYFTRRRKGEASGPVPD